MKTRVSSFIACVGIALLVLCPSTGWAQEADARPKEGIQEGIAVHGHWTIEVVRDGRVLQRHEFENELVLGGASRIAAFLSRSSTLGVWMVDLQGGASLDGPCGDVGSPGLCRIREPDLTVALVQQSDPPRFELRGSVVATNDGGVETVVSGVGACDASVAPQDCVTQNIQDNLIGTAFTRKSLDSPVVGIQSGDTINVTVAISFPYSGI